jgi:hypothetical protein
MTRELASAMIHELQTTDFCHEINYRKRGRGEIYFISHDIFIAFSETHHSEDEKNGCLRSKPNNNNNNLVEVRDKSCWDHMTNLIDYL